MWKNIKPVYGNQIRVNRGMYYHHGIYEDDNHVYQFAAPQGSEVSSENALIIYTTLEEFLKGGEVEVRVYDENEINDVRSPEEVVNYAKSKLGTGLGTYNLVSNNCEHFSNMCAFGVAKSNQVDDFMNVLRGLFQ